MNRNLSAIAALLLTVSSVARADLEISIGSLNLGPGQTGTVAVTITDTGNVPVDLSSFGFEFRLTTVSGPDRLEFTPDQPSPYGGAVVGGPLLPYVFAGDSGQQDTPGPQGSVSSSNAPNDSYVGFDYTNDGADVLLSGRSLLTELSVTATTDLPPVIGDMYRIDLIPDANTFFASNSSPNLPYSVSGGGLVSISAVPGPTSLILSSLGVASIPLVRRRLRVRKLASPKKT